MRKVSLCFALLLLSVFIGCSKKKSKSKKIITSVKVQEVISKTIPITLPAVGHVTPFNSADIKAQVEGVLSEVNFSEGHYVQEGELLLKIDSEPYQAKLEEANATLVEDMARFKYAADKVARYEGLLKDDYVSALDFEQYLEQRTSLEAQVMRDRAEVRLATINLDYCFIKAPFSGIISKKLVDKGNLITNNGKTLASIKQINPIYIDFSIPEDSLATVMTKQKKSPLSLSIQTSDNERIYEAKLVMIDNTVNENTGMIQLRGQLKNTDRTLWPGQFSSIKLLIEKKRECSSYPYSSCKHK